MQNIRLKKITTQLNQPISVIELLSFKTVYINPYNILKNMQFFKYLLKVSIKINTFLLKMKIFSRFF